jgi:AHBA synthesis associated protein
MQWPRAVIFDLDGVLVDSFAVMRKAFAVAYREVVGGERAPFEEYSRHLGRYFPEIMRIMRLPAEMEAPFVRESQRLAGDVEVFRGVPEMLAALRNLGIRTAVATGKSGDRARSLLRLHGLLGLLDTVVGSDEVARPKPHPDIVRRVLTMINMPASATVMIGDAVTDLRSAKSAGVTAAAAIWGDCDEIALRAEEPDLVMHSPEQVLALCGWDQRLLRRPRVERVV